MQKQNPDTSFDRYRIFETGQFLKDFRKIKGRMHNKLNAKLVSYVYPQLKRGPHFGQNIKRLVNWHPPTWRYRLGNYRLFYELNEEDRIVFILTIETRENAY